jgi:hypothetical protein
MVEMITGYIPAADLQPAPDQGVQHEFGKKRERDRPEDVEQLALVVQEMLPPMPQLGWRAEAGGAPGRQRAVAEKARKAGGADSEAAADKTSQPTARIPSGSGETPRTAVHAAVRNPLQAAPGDAALPALNSGMTEHIEETDTERADVVRNTMPPRELPSAGGGAKSGAAGNREFAPPAASGEQAQGMHAQAAAGASRETQPGWVYRFRSWGEQHAVRISPQPGTAAQQLALQPSSSLVEQRLSGHAGTPAGGEHWVLQEHREDRRDSREHARQQQEDDEQ